MANPNQLVYDRACLAGVRQIAEELGVSRMWVWQVRTGRGKSARIAAALKARGIPVVNAK
jgi:hypothetical protein